MIDVLQFARLQEQTGKQLAQLAVRTSVPRFRNAAETQGLKKSGALIRTMRGRTYLAKAFSGSPEKHSKIHNNAKGPVPIREHKRRLPSGREILVRSHKRKVRRRVFISAELALKDKRQWDAFLAQQLNQNLAMVIPRRMGS